jgi:low temperature requirement protein LtrA
MVRGDRCAGGGAIFGKVGGFAVQPAHFVERHGLVMIIAPRLILAALLALALAAGVWWSYFARDDQRAEHAMSHAEDARRSRMALYGYGYGHLVMVAGVVLLAAGLKELIAHLADPVTFTSAALLGCGIALYLLGDVIFRAALHIGANGLRLLMSAASLVCIAAGVWLGGLAELAALLLLLMVIVWAEHSRPAKRAEVVPL